MLQFAALKPLEDPDPSSLSIGDPGGSVSRMLVER
jgi:hypothetical protein